MVILAIDVKISGENRFKGKPVGAHEHGEGHEKYGAMLPEY